MKDVKRIPRREPKFLFTLGEGGKIVEALEAFSLSDAMNKLISSPGVFIELGNFEICIAKDSQDGPYYYYCETWDIGSRKWVALSKILRKKDVKVWLLGQLLKIIKGRAMRKDIVMRLDNPELGEVEAAVVKTPYAAYLLLGQYKAVTSNQNNGSINIWKSGNGYKAEINKFRVVTQSDFLTSKRKVRIWFRENFPSIV